MVMDNIYFLANLSYDDIMLVYDRLKGGKIYGTCGPDS